MSKSRKTNNRWTEEEELYILKNYEKMTIEGIAQVLGRTPGAVRARISSKPIAVNNGKAWTKEEDEFILNNYRKMTDEQLAKRLKRSRAAVTARRYSKLMVSNEFHAGVDRIINRIGE